MDAVAAKRSLPNKKRPSYVAMDATQKEAFLPHEQQQCSTRVCANPSSSIPPIQPPVLAAPGQSDHLGASVVAAVDSSSGPSLPADAASARSVRNERARARYASMDPVKKASLLARRRSLRSEARASVVSDTTNEHASNLLSGVSAFRPPSSGEFNVGSLSASDVDTLPNACIVLPGATESCVVSVSARFRMVSAVPIVKWVLPSQGSCDYCGAFRFHRETAGFCCGSGQVSLAKTVLSPILWFLFTDPTSEIAREFHRRGRTYNGAFAFTSIGMTFDPQSWWARDGVYALKVLGQVTHFFNAIDGSANKGALLQLFFLDTAEDLDVAVLESKELRQDIMDLLIQALSGNPYTTFFKRLRSWGDLDTAHIVIRSSPALDQRNCNAPTADQVAAVWKDGDEAISGSERDIRVYTDAGHSRKINYYYSCYDPLQYPTLFPRGEPGWHAGIQKCLGPLSLRRGRHSLQVDSQSGPNDAVSVDDMLLQEEQVLQENRNIHSNVSCREYYCYKAQIRQNDCSYLLHAGRIGQQFFIDMYIKLETSRLDYYRSEQFQNEVRTESYQGIIDSLGIDRETDASNIGQRVVLPSSFIGGPRDMRKRYVNAMALVQRFGKPDLFLTITCNPAWKEIQDHLLPGQKPDDRPDLVARVFKSKLEELKNDIVKKKLFGQVAAYVYTVEYQKRGLPHAHWVILLDARHKIVSPLVYDEVICAELPDSSHPFLRAYVVKHMMHGPCGESNPSNVCMRDGHCKNHYPKEFSDCTSNGHNSYPVYRRRDDGKSVVVRNQRLDNRWVVPYCPYLLAKFDCHINVEICADVKLVKYLYKYIHKGHDRLSYHVVSNLPEANQDEIQAYQSGRWVCAPEAFWRIFSFPMSEMYPAVIVLPVHLPNHQPLRFGATQSLEKLAANPRSSMTMLTEFFKMNGSNADAVRLNLLYKEFPEHFVWNSSQRKWKLRQKQIVVGRLCTVNPSEGERYFERLLLVNFRCPVSFDDLMTVNGHTYETFREAAVSRGLLESDEYVDGCLAEAVLYQAPYCLRVLFALLLVYGITADPQLLWDKYYSSFSEDFSHSGLYTSDGILRETIAAIDTVLTSMDKSLSDFPIRFSSTYAPMTDRLSRDYHYECSMSVPKEDLVSIGRLNQEQRIAYDKVVRKIDGQIGGAFFLDGPGGTGKTFLYRALLAYVRSKGGIALAVASSGVAASLLPGGRTAHSRFKLPLDVDDTSTAKISKQSSLAKMIVEARLIIWDEASMANRHSIESLDALLRDLADDPRPFGDKIVLFGGDFRQTLPIVLHGSKDSMIEASFVSSKLWRHVTRLMLTQNMRAKDDPSFVDFLLRVGDGKEPFVADDNIRIPSSMLIPFTDDVTSLDCLIVSVYPSFDEFFTNPYSMMNRAILTPKNECVGEINDLLLSRFPGQVKEYVSFNRTNDSLQQGEYEDYLSSVSASGLPPHVLRLKKNCPIMLLRNLNPLQGLCNGTRLICRDLGDNFIEAEIAVGDFKGNRVFIPRIPLESSDKLKCPIPFQRMQIPVRLCFVMTINKAQGQTMDFVGIYLRQPVFSHGQLYVALSRAKNSSSIKILIHPNLKRGVLIDYTKNLVYHDVFKLANGTPDTV